MTGGQGCPRSGREPAAPSRHPTGGRDGLRGRDIRIERGIMALFASSFETRRKIENKNMNTPRSYFQDVIESVESLSPDDQMLLVEIIRQRLIEIRRNALAAEVTEARGYYQTGEVQRGTVDVLISELDA